MALSADERLADALLKRHLRIQQFSSYEANKIMAVMLALSRELKKKTIEIDPTEPHRIKYRNQRAKKLMEEAEKIIKEKFSDAYSGFRSDLYELAGMEAVGAVDAINTSIGVTLATSKAITPQTAKVVVDEAYIEGGLLKDWFARAAEGYRLGFQKELRAGMNAGEGIDKIVRRIIGGAREFPGDKTLYDKQKRGTESLVRTAVMTVANDTRQKIFEANSDVFKGYRWLATLDTRTCFVCGNLDLKEWDLGKKPINGNTFEFVSPPRHWGCRCVLLPILKTWRELGIDIDEPPESERASQFGPVPAGTSFNEWTGSWNSETQNEYFGRGRYGMYKQGKITFTDLVTQKGRPLDLNELRQLSPQDPRVSLLVKENAVIPDKKILQYTLNKEHKKGGPKAINFEKVLGYNLGNADEFKSALLDGLEYAKKAFVSTNKQGEDLFEAIMQISGPSGQTARVITSWKQDAKKSDAFSFVTAYIRSKRAKDND